MIKNTMAAAAFNWKMLGKSVESVICILNELFEKIVLEISDPVKLLPI
jgi:hypothetical protein